MTKWKTVIKDCPDLDELRYLDPASTAYEDWLDKVMAEPWATALEDMVRWTGLWCGSESQLIAELRMRAGTEVGASPDFPSSFRQLREYVWRALDGFMEKRIGLFHWRDLSEEDLDDFHVPGWGPEAPVVIFEGDAPYRPDFQTVQFELLKYRHPVPVAIFHLTASRDFPESRVGTYATKDLSELLVKYYPTYRNVRRAALDAARPEGVEALEPRFGNFEEWDAVSEPFGLRRHLIFHKQMKKWAPILKERARIRVSWEKRLAPPGVPVNNDVDGPPRTYWTIEAPRWRNPDRFRGTWML